jgi:hypothetical protein
MIGLEAFVTMIYIPLMNDFRGIEAVNICRPREGGTGTWGNTGKSLVRIRLVRGLAIPHRMSPRDG